MSTVSDLVGEEGRPRLLSDMCATCIFRRGNLMHLEPGRLAQMLAKTRREGFIPCHETLPYGPRPSLRMALCRGWWNACSDVSDWVRAVRAIFGGFTEVDPP